MKRNNLIKDMMCQHLKKNLVFRKTPTFHEFKKKISALILKHLYIYIWWNVTKYIYSGTVLKYQLLYLSSILCYKI